MQTNYLTTKFKTMFQTHYGGHPPTELRFEKPTTQPSQTIPDQSLSIQELLRRNANGLSLMGSKQPEYDDDGTGEEITFDDFIPDVSKMDLADKQEFMEQARLHLESVKTKLNALASAREKQRRIREQEFKELKEFKEKSTQSGQSTQPQKPADS